MKKIIVITLSMIAMVSLLTAFENGHREGEGRRGSHNPRVIQEHHPDMMDNHFEPDMRRMEELDLTDSQKEEMAEFRTKHQKEMIDLQAELKKILIDKRDAVKDHDFDNIRKITKKIFEIKEDIALKRIELHEKKWDILTAKQKEKAENLMRDFPHKKNFRKFHKK